MDVEFTLQTPDGTPLGKPEDILTRLNEVFPEISYELLTKTPEPEIPLNGAYWKFRYWLWMRFDRTQYPHYEGFLGRGGMFRFAGKPPVDRVRVWFWSSPEHDALLDKLLARTGWNRRPIERRRGLLDVLGRL